MSAKKKRRKTPGIGIDMHILVNVPKKEIDHFWEPVPRGNLVWWTLPVQPKKFKVGEYLYFQIGSEIVARVQIEEISKDDLICDSTKRDWKGVHLCWSGGMLERLENPLPGESLRRGFKYLDVTP